MRRTRKQQQATASEALESRTLLSGSATPSIDGTGNNIANPDWGSTDTELLRTTTSDYGDGLATPAGADRPSAREVSNAVAAVGESELNDRQLTDLLWVWGQFIDHDIDITEGAVDENGDPFESFPIEVPLGDVFFDPFNTGTQTIGLNRSNFAVDGDGVWQQINSITAFLDGSVIYGSDIERANELRTFSGGRLKTSAGDLLPFNEAGLDNAGGTSSSLFLAGDVRANENVALTAMQTIWVREHNRIADEISAKEPHLSDEQVYQKARKLVSAELQVITYNEYLPALLGVDAIDEYTGYDPTVNPGIANIFSTAAYRFGHSLLSSELLRLDANGTEAAEGNLALQSAFFNPSEIVDNGVDSILRGIAAQVAQELDNEVVDDVRNFLFGPPGAGGFDLASLNIQRGRDHGLASYNQARIDLGLAPVDDFTDITSDADLALKLELLYDDVDNVDVWVGGLAEDHLPGSSMGELFSTVIADQFTRLRDGDRFYYENVFSGKQLRDVERTTLADVIERNSDADGLQQNAFFAKDAPQNQHVRQEIIGRASTGTVVVSELGRHGLRSQVVGVVPTGVDWDNFYYGDFNGDGLTDAAGRSSSDGYWRVMLNDGEQLASPRLWTRWSTAVDWDDVFVGDFNGDSIDDIAGRASTGTWNVSLSNGSRFTPRGFGAWSSSTTYHDLQTADLNGDGKTDIIARMNDGRWVGGLSTGTRFQNRIMGAWSTNVDWHNVTVGDFNADGKDDVAARASSGTLVVALSNGNSFQMRAIGAFANSAGYHDIRFGDFNGDGRMDISGLTANGRRIVGLSDGQRVQMQEWGRMSPHITWGKTLVGDFNGDGRDDILSRASNGSWVASMSRGDHFDIDIVGAWSTQVGWDNVAVGNFT